VQILADENIPRVIVHWLRLAGHDVLYAAEDRIQSPDADLLSEAEAQRRVILTQDKEFGELVFRDHLNSHGVILIRMENSPASSRLARLQRAWATVEMHVPGKFVVITKTKVRVRTLTAP
jgi:predicted nuclease of predicted toxin-antitoxin system